MSLQYFYDILKELPSGSIVITSVGNANGIGTAAAADVGSLGIIGNANGVGTANAFGPSGAKTIVGWFDGWDKRRRIPVERLNEILKAQGREPFPVAELEAKVAKAQSPKLRKVVEEALEEVAVRAEEPYDWTPVVTLFRAVTMATRTTAAIRNTERIIPLLRERMALEARERDDEEAIALLMLNG